MDEEYQEKHLNFTSNNNGSTIEEILLAGLPIHLSTLLVSLASLLPLDPSSILFQTLELTGLLAPPLFSLTILSEEPEYVNAGVGCVILLIFLVIFFKKKGAKDLKKLWDLRISDDGVLDSLTNFRSSMLLVTAICILAVDFPVFPRKFGKTETFGYGLMDMGVGGFVFAAGLTSLEGRGKETSIVKTMKSSAPLLVLGLARLSVITITGYHSNITEYGVHWNFFFSLFFVKVLGSILIPNIPGGRSIWVCSVIVAVVYEGFLSFGLVDWILLEEPRSGLLDSNKEGICSTLGYLAIYLAGVSWAKEIIHKQLTFTLMANMLHDVCIWSGLMWLSLIYSTTFFLPPSRRLANYTFFTFVVAYSLSILAGFLLIEVLVIVIGEWKCGSGSDGGRKDKKSRYILNKKKHTENEIGKSVPVTYAKGVRAPTLFKAISYNALSYFLLSNLLTGAVNMLIPTMETEGCPAILVLSAYLLTLSLFSMTLYRKKWKLL